jgi:hypothetical protein
MTRADRFSYLIDSLRKSLIEARMMYERTGRLEFHNEEFLGTMDALLMVCEHERLTDDEMFLAYLALKADWRLGDHVELAEKFNDWYKERLRLLGSSW